METTLVRSLKLILAIFILLLIISLSSSAIKNASGVDAVAEGTVSSKTYTPAHTDAFFFLITYSSNFKPDKWEIMLIKYDTAAQKWETATIDVDKDTYDQLKIGDHFKDIRNRKVFFIYE